MSKIKPLFEHVTCSRCDGSGTFSWNAMHGSRCYGCNGSGYQLTARGRAAQLYLNGLRKIPAEEFKVGDMIWCEGFQCGVWATVTEVTLLTGAEMGRISEPDAACVRIVADRKGKSMGYNTFVGSLHRKGFTGAEKDAQRADALAYQAILTKAGKPRKAATKTEVAA
jgi:hypothetical protein